MFLFTSNFDIFSLVVALLMNKLFSLSKFNEKLFFLSIKSNSSKPIRLLGCIGLIIS